jgi:ribonuclease J
VVFSANPIPGNTIAVVNTIDQLMMQGANVVYGKGAGIHVSGHGCQEDHKLMIALTKPKFFLPVHGEHRMLVQHCKTAQSMGIPAENMVVIDNGDVVELTQSSIGIPERVTAGIELVDTSRSGMVDGQALKERQKLAEDGMVTMVAIVSNSGKLLSPPVVQLRGVVTSAQPERVHQWASREIELVLENRWGEFCRRFSDGEVEIDWIGLQAEIAIGMERRLKRELKCVPMIVCILQSASASRSATHGPMKAVATANGNGNSHAVAALEPEAATVTMDTPQPRLRRRRSSAAGVGLSN